MILLWVRDVTSQSRVSRLGSVGASGVRRKALIALGYEKENERSSPDADDKAAFARAAHRPVAASRLGRTGRGALERARRLGGRLDAGGEERGARAERAAGHARRHRVRSPRDGLGTSGDVRSTRRRARRRAARRRGTRDAAGGDAEGESHRRDGAKRADRSRSASRCGARRRTLEEDTGGSRCTRDLDYGEAVRHCDRTVCESNPVPPSVSTRIRASLAQCITITIITTETHRDNTIQKTLLFLSAPITLPHFFVVVPPLHGRRVQLVSASRERFSKRRVPRDGVS
mgnify:CR=1 FL=1